MHNNSNICIINPRIPRQTKQKKRIVFLWRHDDVSMVLFIFSSSWTQPGSGEEKKNSPKILRIFQQKYLDFHPQTSILQSKPKKMHKKTHNSKNQTNPNFRNIIKWAPKITKIDGFCSKQYSLQVSNLNRAWKPRINTKRKKKPQKMSSVTRKREIKKLTQNCSSNVNHACSNTNWREFKLHRITC